MYTECSTGRNLCTMRFNEVQYILRKVVCYNFLHILHSLTFNIELSLTISPSTTSLVATVCVAHMADPPKGLYCLAHDVLFNVWGSSRLPVNNGQLFHLIGSKEDHMSTRRQNINHNKWTRKT